jgi:mannose-1-phosphate guanylyltransferase
MQALILVGGFATRLRPLTDKRPKALLPILNKPMIVHLIDKVSNLVDEVILAVNYGREHLENYFKEHDCGVKVTLNPEDEPLGTGGAIKNAQDLINDTFIVFNGDVITSIDITNLVKFHREKSGIGVLALWHVEDPTRFGIIAIDSQNKITKFQEKPKPEEVFSHLINAGTYCLEPEILDQIPGGKKVSIEREIFPNVLDKKLYGLEFTGYWFDAGTPEIYVETHRRMFDYYHGKDELATKTGRNVRIAKTANVHDSVVMGDNCKIGDNSVIGPYVFLGNDIEIGSSCQISNAVIHDGTIFENKISGDNFILGMKNRVFAHQSLPSGLISGDDYIIDDEFIKNRLSS